MRASDITVGMTLELKPERAEAYGFKSGDGYVNVTRIKARPGHKVPWIIRDKSDGTYEAFKPSDFARCISHHTPTYTDTNDNRARYYQHRNQQRNRWRCGSVV